tara:strand:- start:3897 stop:4244 length:348 start_codon:yes stop_codon:yes gene_type:complete
MALFATSRKHELRFRDLVIHSLLGQRFLRAFDDAVQRTGAEVEAAVNSLVQSHHVALDDLGVPRGFHNNVMRLLRHSAATGQNSLLCRICASKIDAVRDFARNRRMPCCARCAAT